ncbi:hypothetical protein [Haladaptatus sp. NG-SE-30]
MPFDSARVANNADAIQTHLTDFAAGVTSVDSWAIVPEQRGNNVIVTIEFTA